MLVSLHRSVSCVSDIEGKPSDARKKQQRHGHVHEVVYRHVLTLLILSLIG